MFSCKLFLQVCRRTFFVFLRLFLSSLHSFKFFIYPFDALRPRGGPYFLPLQKVGKDRRKGVSPPCGSPDQSGVLDAPLWKPPSPRWRGKFSRTPRRFAAGASVPLGKTASACALATAAAPPPLRLGAAPPGPPRFPNGKVCRSRACWGLWPPLPPRFPKRKVRRSCANAHGTALVAALRATPPQICRKLLPRSGEEFRHSPRAVVAAGHSSATAGGIPKGAQPSLASLCLLSAGQKVGAPARPERVEGKK